ncbi:MAG: PQQ-binding-like beta-propeller repeat protein [Euryarchaeota archaeon]|nr:PQQ-binding-like beta-propeller repeat protein [Euryarchaeota archaeon]
MAIPKILPLFVALLFVAIPVLGATPDDGWPASEGWTHYGGSPRHEARSPAIGPEKATEAAVVALKGPSFTAPVMDATGDLYVGSDRDEAGTVTKLTPGLGVVWHRDIPGNIRASLLIGPDAVYAAPVDGRLYALDPESGAVLWDIDVGNRADGGFTITAAPTWHPDGFVVQPSMDGKVYAVADRTTEGEVLWTYDTTGDGAEKLVAAAAIADDGTIYTGGQNGFLYALTPEGELKWKVATAELGRPAFPEQQVAAPAIGADGTVYVGTRVSRDLTGAVYAFKDTGSKAERLWVRQLDEKIVAPVAIGPDGDLFVGDIAGSFFRLEKADGAIVWRFNAAEHDPTIDSAVREHTLDTRTLSVAEQALVDAAGRVYVSYWHVDLTKGFPPQESFKSPFYALDAESGKIVWRHVSAKTARAPMMMPSEETRTTGTHDGVLYLATDAAKVHAFADASLRPPGRAATPSETITPPETNKSAETAAATDTTPTANETSGDTPSPTAVTVLIVVTSLLLFARRGRKRER